MIPATVAVVGSCATRDNFNSRFNPDWRRWYDVTLTTNQSSMVSLMSPPVDEPFAAVRPLSDYDVWNVRNDLNREVLDQVAERRPAHLLLDFFGDVHFGLLQLPDGRYVTDNRWKLHRTDLYERWVAEGGTRTVKLLTDTEEYLALWREAMDRFAAHLAEHSPGTVVTVHRGFNVDRVLVPGRAAPGRLRRHARVAALDVARANALWAELDEHCLTSYGWESVDLRDEDWTTFTEHPWGPFYVHYTLDYYPRFLAELHKIHLRHHGADEPFADTYDRLLAVEAAARGRGESRRELGSRVGADLRGRLETQQARVAELEGLGPGRAVRFAVGQRLRARKSRREAQR